MFTLYTREFGLVRAIAQGIREIKSKLRYSLQPYSLSVVNLVHGRSGWRITNARLEKNYFAVSDEADMAVDRHGTRRVVLAHACALLKRMLHGEERNAELFDSFIEGLAFLESVADDKLPDVEVIIVLRILYHLGYVGRSSLSDSLVKSPLGEEVLLSARKQRRHLLRSINESLQASHL